MKDDFLLALDLLDGDVASDFGGEGLEVEEPKGFAFATHRRRKGIDFAFLHPEINPSFESRHALLFFPQQIDS